MVGHLLVQLGLNGFERISIDDSRLLASQGLALEGHIANVEPVAKQIGERASREGIPPTFLLSSGSAAW